MLLFGHLCDSFCSFVSWKEMRHWIYPTTYLEVHQGKIPELSKQRLICYTFVLPSLGAFFIHFCLWRTNFPIFGEGIQRTHYFFSFTPPTAVETCAQKRICTENWSVSHLPVGSQAIVWCSTNLQGKKSYKGENSCSSTHTLLVTFRQLHNHQTFVHLFSLSPIA